MKNLTRSARYRRMDLVGMMVTLLFLEHLGVGVQVDAQTLLEGPFLKPNGLCETFVLQIPGYACTEYVVGTEDGFRLGVQRIARGSQLAVGRTPILLWHGIISGGDSWFLDAPDTSLPLRLADGEYDVWVGNTRTTTYSDGHVSMTRNDKKFWDWSLDELVAYDFPSMVRFVAAETNRRIHYVGYSQGTQAAFAAFSQGQETLDLIDKVVMLAPVAYTAGVTSEIARVAASIYLEQFFVQLGVNEFSTKLASGTQFVDILCSRTSTSRACYKDYVTAFAGQNCCFNTSRRLYYDTFETQSTAVKNLGHLAQMLRTDRFAKYNYGLLGNLWRYASFSSPAYNLASIPPSKPLFLIHGGQDALADPPDVQRLLQELPGNPQVLYLPDYAHIDFILGATANTDVYPNILAFLSP